MTALVSGFGYLIFILLFASEVHKNIIPIKDLSHFSTWRNALRLAISLDRRDLLSLTKRLIMSKELKRQDWHCFGRGGCHARR
jgi:hypothetical protein